MEYVDGHLLVIDILLLAACILLKIKIDILRGRVEKLEDGQRQKVTEVK